MSKRVITGGLGDVEAGTQDKQGPRHSVPRFATYACDPAAGRRGQHPGGGATIGTRQRCDHDGYLCACAAGRAGAGRSRDRAGVAPSLDSVGVNGDGVGLGSIRHGDRAAGHALHVCRPNHPAIADPHAGDGASLHVAQHGRWTDTQSCGCTTQGEGGLGRNCARPLRGTELNGRELGAARTAAEPCDSAVSVDVGMLNDRRLVAIRALHLVLPWARDGHEHLA